MNERIRELAEQAWVYQMRVYQENGVRTYGEQEKVFSKEKFAELIQEDMYRKVIASILITDVIMEEKGQKPTSEDYIVAINKDFGFDK